MGLNSWAATFVSFYKSVAGCLHSRKYERLREKRKKRVLVLKVRGQNGRSGVFRLKAVPKLRIVRSSPKSLLAKVRDSFVNVMLSMSSSAIFSSRILSNNLGFQCSAVVQPFGKISIAQFDEEDIIREMYKSAVVQRQVSHRSITLPHHT